ncbi:hypothetical protein niasHT_027198 [Heterodera trifolii]|uniref:Uncharacterized protein n=1 Tax=Heterodera trifolii TaxID=157864 RepID=A0ABD2KNN1_9BILA
MDEKVKKREEEKKAEEKAKKDKEEVKAAFKKIGMSTEVGGKEDENKPKKKKLKNKKGKDTENGNLEAEKLNDEHKMDDVLLGDKLGMNIYQQSKKKKQNMWQKRRKMLKKRRRKKHEKKAEAKKDAEKAKREAKVKKDTEENVKRDAKEKKDAEERAKREEAEKEAAAETKRDAEATAKIHSEKEEKGKREGNVSINVEGAKKIMETISEKWTPKIVGSIFDPRGEGLGDDWTIKKCQENRGKKDRLRDEKSEERTKACKEWTQPKNQWESGGTAQGRKRFFENTLKSAVISANETRAIPPEGMGWKRHVQCFKTEPPGPGFKRRYHDVSPIRRMYSTGQGTSAASGTEEKIVKIRIATGRRLIGRNGGRIVPI